MSSKSNWEDEKKNLAKTNSFIDSEVKKQKNRVFSAAHQNTANEIARIYKTYIDGLNAMKGSPYFGRIKSSIQSGNSSSGKLDDVYFTRGSTLEAAGIYSWTRSDLYQLWISDRYDNIELLSEGTIRNINLKRAIGIKDRELSTVDDVYLRNNGIEDTQIVDESPSKALVGALSETGDQILQDVVETLTEDQYHTISSEVDKVLIVQGSAGSGKSEIGIHRIAFLLAPDLDARLGINSYEVPTPETTLYIGPSQSFLEYSQNILPDLGVVEGVERTTLNDWLKSKQTINIRRKWLSEIYSRLVNAGDMGRFDESSEYFKGSVDMIKCIDRYLNTVVSDIKTRVRDLPSIMVNFPIYDDTHNYTISRREINSILSKAFSTQNKNLGLNDKREWVLDQLVDTIWAKGRYAQKVQFAQHPVVKRNLKNEKIYPWFDRAWRILMPDIEYREMLSNSLELFTLSNGKLTDDQLGYLKNSVQRSETRGFQDSDRGAILYLDHLLNNTIQPRYKHIVVDEAQDLSPIEFKLLQLSSSNNWFTILGDRNQRLTPYKGIKQWKDLQGVFGRRNVTIRRIPETYRSTEEITRFSNKVLRTFASEFDQPRAFDRAGYRTEYHVHHGTQIEMYFKVIDEIQRIKNRLLKSDNSTVAILCRSNAEVEAFQKFIVDYGLPEIPRIGLGHHSTDRTVISRIPDSKGLEYDAIILLGLERKSKNVGRRHMTQQWASTEFNRRLLYLGVTRARHYLGIHWLGHNQESEIIKSEVSSRGVNVIQH